MRGTLRMFRARVVCLMLSPLSPGLIVRPTREGGAAPSEGVLLPTMLEDFDDSVLGDPISYMRFEQLPGSESPLSLPVYAWPPSLAFLMDSAVIQTVLAPRKSERLAAGTSVADPPVTEGEDRLLETGLPDCLYRFLETGELPFTDGNPAYGLQLHHPRFLDLGGFSRPDCWTVHHRSGWNTWAKNRRWRRPSIYNGTRVLCCRICKYCPRLLWQ